MIVLTSYRGSPPSLHALPFADVPAVVEAIFLVLAQVLQIMPELMGMCVEPVSSLSREHLEGDSIVALAAVPTTLEPSQVFENGERSCLLMFLWVRILLCSVWLCLIPRSSSQLSFMISHQTGFCKIWKDDWMRLEGKRIDEQMSEVQWKPQGEI